MNTPLDVAVDIGRIVVEAQMSTRALDLANCADHLLARFPHCGISRRQIMDTLHEEAVAAGLALN
jgi:hypothetical protein